VPHALPQVVVPDALRALQQLGRAWRADFTIPIVAVAGSNGKTTVKEMTAAILSRMGLVMATRGNLNNHIGVPVTLMRLEASHRSAVIEMGANRIGDVAELVGLARPTVGSHHTTPAPSISRASAIWTAVAQGEGEMVSCLEPAATAIINADDVYAGYWTSVATARRVVTFGVHANADFHGEEFRTGHRARRIRHALHAYVSPGATRHHAQGRRRAQHRQRTRGGRGRPAPPAPRSRKSPQALATFARWPARLQLKAGTRGSWIIDDSYNANPSSVRAGLEVLRSLPGATWLVLGDMAELGEFAEDSHAHMGAYARDCGIKRLFAMGPQSSRAVETFGAGAEWFADADSLTRRLLAELTAGVTVLVKGSRVNRLERVVQALTGGAS